MTGWIVVWNHDLRICRSPNLTAPLAFNAALAYSMRFLTKDMSAGFLAGLPFKEVSDKPDLSTTTETSFSAGARAARSCISPRGLPSTVSRGFISTRVVRTTQLMIISKSPFNGNKDAAVHEQVNHHTLSLLPHHCEHLLPFRPLHHSHVIVEVRDYNSWNRRNGAIALLPLPQTVFPEALTEYVLVPPVVARFLEQQPD